VSSPENPKNWFDKEDDLVNRLAMKKMEEEKKRPREKKSQEK
jgi:hypothetical protein